VSGIAIRGLALGELDTNCWLVSDGEGGPLVVIDPAGEPERLLAEIGSRAVASVVLTHGHFDHLGAAAALLARTSAPLLVHAADAPSITDAMANGGASFGFTHVAPAADRTVADGDVIEAGTLKLKVIYTPGHTPGSICLLAETGEGPHLFSGDTLFSGSVGRTDFPGGSGRDLARSILKLSELPPETVVHTGHGPDTTLERESRINFFWPRR
jgi:glyoxylase-like metal-dependent hydrolase (beta-lactamase superfamily II)